MNQFLQVSGEIEEMIGCFSRPNTTSLQIPDLERYRTIMEPNTLEYFKDKFDKIIQEYHLAMKRNVNLYILDIFLRHLMSQDW
ncbi:hypothetical protein CEXT_601531 [Caerostris extrusa]|uniref:Uncharacterized protein n=1 Tax=Caerostris extrusa TaxID=172846 RepID=A0AAV4SW45_CAEEX|nr:hypothetical protein CEXT_601531 [Caerostris extrusa]